MTTATPPADLAADASHTVDVHIAVEVIKQAKARCDSQGHTLRAVARAVFFAAADAASAVEPSPDPPSGSRPPLREYGQPRQRVRFTVPLGAFLPAAAAIERSNSTLANAVEQGLVHYIRTGNLCPPPPIVDQQDDTTGEDESR